MLCHEVVSLVDVLRFEAGRAWYGGASGWAVGWTQNPQNLGTPHKPSRNLILNPKP